MKKTTSQVFVAIVCALLGFLLAYQFKVLAKNNSDGGQSLDKTNIVAEIDGLKKEKEGLQKTNSELSEKIKALEESAASEGKVGAELIKQLDTARMLLGTEDVTGPGVTVTVSPRTQIFGSSSDESRSLSEFEVIHLVNVLWFSGAEAISINDYRITPQMGIRNSANYIRVGANGVINPKEKLVIKAIGNKKVLAANFTFPGIKDYLALKNYDFDIKQSEDVVINKTSQATKVEYLRPVKE